MKNNKEWLSDEELNKKICKIANEQYSIRKPIKCIDYIVLTIFIVSLIVLIFI